MQQFTLSYVYVPRNFKKKRKRGPTKFDQSVESQPSPANRFGDLTVLRTHKQAQVYSRQNPRGGTEG